MSGNRMNATFYMYRRPGDADVAILDPDAFDHPAYIHASYHKGSQVLRMLESRIGVTAFTQALRGLVARGAGGLTVGALADEVMLASGEDVTEVLDQWLRTTGFPVLTVEANRIDVRGAFDLRVPIRETFSDGQSIERLVDLGTGTSEIERRGDAVLLEVDPAWSLAREVHPSVEGDVTLDGLVDAADLIAIALRDGTMLPEERRRDGGFDPLFDLDGDRVVGVADIDRALALAR
jgi:hypothetical protein